MDIGDILNEFDKVQGYKCFLYRNRPYRGQPHTDQGDRGRQEIHGITMRDLTDAFVMAAFDAGNDQDPTGKHFDKECKGEVTLNDIYKLDLNKIDPIAWSQNLTCRIEKMMGIFPNVPGMKKEN